MLILCMLESLGVVWRCRQSFARGSSEFRARMLLGSGSNKSFVTTSVKEWINPKVKRKECLQLTTFGDSSEQSGLRDVVEPELCSLSGGSVNKIEAYVVPVILALKMFMLILLNAITPIFKVYGFQIQIKVSMIWKLLL